MAVHRSTNAAPVNKSRVPPYAASSIKRGALNYAAARRSRHGTTDVTMCVNSHAAPSSVLYARNSLVAPASQQINISR